MHGPTATESPFSFPEWSLLAGGECGGCSRTSAVCTALMIFLRASKSSLHFSRACNSRCRFSVIVFSGISPGRFAVAPRSSNPISLATNEEGVLEYSGELAAFDRRISGGSVGLLSTLTAHVSRLVSKICLTELLSSGEDGEVLAALMVADLVGDGGGFRCFSCFLPEIVAVESWRNYVKNVEIIYKGTVWQKRCGSKWVSNQMWGVCWNFDTWRRVEWCLTCSRWLWHGEFPAEEGWLRRRLGGETRRVSSLVSWAFFGVW